MKENFMIEIKALWEDGQFIGTIQTDDGEVSMARRYRDEDKFNADINSALASSPMSLEQENATD